MRKRRRWPGGIAKGRTFYLWSRSLSVNGCSERLHNHHNNNQDQQKGWHLIGYAPAPLTTGVPVFGEKPPRAGQIHVKGRHAKQAQKLAVPPAGPPCRPDCRDRVGANRRKPPKAAAAGQARRSRAASQHHAGGQQREEAQHHEHEKIGHNPSMPWPGQRGKIRADFPRALSVLSRP